MTNFILDKEKLREILLEHKHFISQKVKTLIAQGIDVRNLTFAETNKFTDEFIETMIKKLPVDNLLDEIDEFMEKTLGYNSKKYLDKNEKIN